MLRGFIHDARVGEVERGFELERGRVSRHPLLRTEEPLEGVEGKLSDRRDGEGARPFTGAMPTHAVRDKKEMSALLANLDLRLRQARFPITHRLVQLGNEELVFVGGAYHAAVGDPEGPRMVKVRLSVVPASLISFHLSTVSACQSLILSPRSFTASPTFRLTVPKPS